MAKNAPSAAARVAQQPAAPAELFRNGAIPFIGIALALAGIVLGFILTRNFFQHTVVGGASGCAISSYVDCDRISQSAFAAVGPVPISAFGLGMHVAVLAALAVAHFSRAPVREGLVGGTVVLALAATAVSVVLAVISLFVIRALCVYCTALQLVNLALAATLAFGLTGGAQRLKRAVQSLAGPGLGAGVLAVGIGIGATVVATYGLSSAADRQLLEQQILEARESRRLAAQQLQEQRIADVRAARQLQEQQFAEARATQRLADLFLSRKRYEFELADSPQLGDRNAPITLVVYADYNCPHCHVFDPKIAAIARAADDVRLAYKFYPLDSTCNRSMPRDRRSTSCAAAAAAYLAHQEGKFWEYSDTLFANFQRYGPNRLVEYAREVGLSDPESARGALDDRKVRSKINADIAEADRAGLRATPTLYINGRQFLINRVPPGEDQFAVILSVLQEARGG